MPIGTPVYHPKSKKPSPLKIVLAGMLGFMLPFVIGGGLAFWSIGMDANTKQQIGTNMICGFYILWAGMGYYGAWKLVKKGHVMNLAGCAILAGGAPILLPLVLVPIIYFWSRSVKDNNAMPNGYLICPKCQQPTLLNASFCAHCGNQIQNKAKR